jgi:hypothetical protein
MLGLILAALACQETETLPRGHRDAYQKALVHYEKAVVLVESDPKQALQEIQNVFDAKNIDHRDRKIQFEKIGLLPSRIYDFFPNQARGRIRLLLARSDPENAPALLSGAVADLKASVDSGMKSSEDLLRAARTAQERLKTAKPPDPPKESAGEQAFRDEWLKLVEDHRFKSARDYVDAKGGALGADRRREYVRDTEQRSSKALKASLEEFLKAMEVNSRPPGIRQLRLADFARIFSLPSESETLGAPPELAWARTERAVIEKVRLSDFHGREEDTTALLGALVNQMIAAEPLEKTGDNRWFREAGQMAVHYAEEQVQALSVQSREATPDQRRRMHERAEKIRSAWADALSNLPKDFLERNPIREGPRRMSMILEEFPVDADEVDRVDLEACLTGDSPDSALEHVISDLTRLRRDQGSRLSKESSRKLLSELIAATAIHELLAGKAVDEVVKGLRELGHSLVQAGGPLEPARWGPKVEKIFAALH